MRRHLLCGQCQLVFFNWLDLVIVAVPGHKALGPDTLTRYDIYHYISRYDIQMIKVVYHIDSM